VELLLLQSATIQFRQEQVLAPAIQLCNGDDPDRSVLWSIHSYAGGVSAPVNLARRSSALSYVEVTVSL